MSKHHSQKTSHHLRNSNFALLYYVQVNSKVSLSWVSSLMTGCQNCCFHKKLVYPTKLFSSLGLITRILVMRGPAVWLKCALKLSATERHIYETVGQIPQTVGRVQVLHKSIARVTFTIDDEYKFIQLLKYPIIVSNTMFNNLFFISFE